MTILFLVFLVVFCLFLLLLVLISIRRPHNFPPGPDFMPYTGNTMQLRKEAQALGGQHLVFENWAKKYNSNVLGLKLRNELVVVVLSYPLVHKVQVEEVYEGRPDNFFLRLRTMGTRKGITCTDGGLWHDHRNWAMKQMRNVGYGRSEMQGIIDDETKSLLNCIEKTNGEPVWPGSFLAPSVINVLWSLTAGKRFERNDKRLIRLLDLLNYRSKIFDMSGGVLSQFPWLRFIMPERIGYNLIQQLNKELYNFFMETIDEHKTCVNLKDAIESDLIFAYIREMNSRSKTNMPDITDQTDNSFNETQLIMTVLDLFIAGSQTTSNTLDLVIMMLALKKEIQAEIFEEISKNQLPIPKSGLSNLSSRSTHPLTNAFLMEVQRYFHIVPISGPRRTLKHTKLDGYDIPKNSTVLISLRSVHMDEKHWSDPKMFRPSRFLDEFNQVRNDEYFMPFGVGRRRCLGDVLARACLFTFVVKIVEKYKIELCENNQPSMLLQPGITLSAKPYKIKFVERTKLTKFVKEH